MFTIHIHSPSFENVKQIEENKSDILFEGGMAIKELLANHLTMLDSQRHRGGNTHFYDPTNVYDPVVDGNFAKVGTSTPGLTRALHSITILPKDAKALAIPIHKDAIGYQPRELNLYKPSMKMFVHETKNGNAGLARVDDSHNLVMMYIFKNQVTQPQDESLLPTNDQLDNAFSEAINDAVHLILGN